MPDFASAARVNFCLQASQEPPLSKVASTWTRCGEPSFSSALFSPSAAAIRLSRR